MKPLLITIFCMYCSLQAVAQYCPPASGKVGDYNLYHITAGFGITKMYGDISNNNAIGSAGTLQFDYQLKKGLYIGLEGQFGVLRTEVTTNADARQSENDYLAGGVVATIHPFEMLLSSKRRNSTNVFLNSIFFGVGALYVVNNFDNIYRNVNDLSSYGPIASYDENGDPVFETRTTSFALPSVNFGLNIPLVNGYGYYGLSMILKGQLNFTNNDLVDGYTPYNSEGRIQGENDVFNYYSLGFRYSF